MTLVCLLTQSCDCHHAGALNVLPEIHFFFCSSPQVKWEGLGKSPVREAVFGKRRTVITVLESWVRMGESLKGAGLPARQEGEPHAPGSRDFLLGDVQGWWVP